MISKGCRVHFDTAAYPHEVEDKLQPGDYWRFVGHDLWLLRAPTGELGSIDAKTWRITEHEDGTITASPSIWFHNPDGSKGWHGYLEAGVWRQC